MKGLRNLHDCVMDALWRSLLLVLAVWAVLVFVGVVWRLYT